MNSVYEELNSLGLINYDNIITASGFDFPYDIIIRKISPHSHILDWGCGNGQLTCFLLSKGLRVTAYTIENLDIAEILKKRWPDQFTYCRTDDPRKLPFQNNTFDSVISMGVLEHVKETGGDEVASLKEIKRVLSPNGSFICLHLPRQQSWIERLAPVFAPGQYRHKYKYNENQVKDMVEQVNLVISEMGVYAMLPRNIAKILPDSIKNSRFISRIYNYSDIFLARFFPNISQNIYFIASKSN